MDSYHMMVIFHKVRKKEEGIMVCFLFSHQMMLRLKVSSAALYLFIFLTVLKSDSDFRPSSVSSP